MRHVRVASPLNPAAPYTVTPLIPDWYWAEVGAFLAWLHVEWEVELVLVPGGFVSWGRSARMKYSDWLTFSGLIGHQHVPGNDHTDPGAIPGATILEHTARIAGAPTMDTSDPRTTADVARMEATLRAEGYDIYDGPSFVKAGKCYPGAPGHGHLRDSTHFATGGGAVDVGKDPASGVAISTFEKAHLDDLARRLMALKYRVLWGVAGHFDHLHFDFNLYGPGGGHQVVFQGPNGEFTVAHILWVQTALKKLSRYTGTLDGLRETITLAAIKAYQTSKKLTPDGEPGRNTSYTIRADLAALAAAPPPVTVDPRPTPAPDPEPSPAPVVVAPDPDQGHRTGRRRPLGDGPDARRVRRRRGVRPGPRLPRRGRNPRRPARGPQRDRRPGPPQGRHPALRLRAGARAPAGRPPRHRRWRGVHPPHAAQRGHRRGREVGAIMGEHCPTTTAAPTQVRRPWRSTTRTIFQAVVGLAAMWALIVEAIGLDADWRWVAASLAVTAAITRVMALPAVERWLAAFVPFLAAQP